MLLSKKEEGVNMFFLFCAHINLFLNVHRKKILEGCKPQYSTMVSSSTNMRNSFIFILLFSLQF